MNHHALLTSVLDDYLAFRDASWGASVRLFETVLVDWEKASGEIAARNHAHGTAFNPFARIKIGETSHSRLLGDLLNPRGSHGQGALFLNVLLDKIGSPIPEPDGWNLTVETGRVDILLWRHHPVKSAIIIENKSNDACDQPNQIYRYWHREMYLWDHELWNTEDQERIRERNQRFHIVYLPTDGGRSPAEHSMTRPADWTDDDNPHLEVPLKCRPLALPDLTGDWLHKALPRIPATNSRLRDFLTQYHELWIA